MGLMVHHDFETGVGSTEAMLPGPPLKIHKLPIDPVQHKKGREPSSSEGFDSSQCILNKHLKHFFFDRVVVPRRGLERKLTHTCTYREEKEVLTKVLTHRCV